MNHTLFLQSVPAVPLCITVKSVPQPLATMTLLRELAVVEQSPTLKASGLSLVTRLPQTLCLWTHLILTWAGVLKIVANAIGSARLEARHLASQQQLASASSFKLRTDAAMVTSSPVRLSGADRRCRHGTVLQTQASVLSRDRRTTTVIQHTSICKMPTCKSHRASAGITLKLPMRK